MWYDLESRMQDCASNSIATEIWKSMVTVGQGPTTREHVRIVSSSWLMKCLWLSELWLNRFVCDSRDHLKSIQSIHIFHSLFFIVYTYLVHYCRHRLRLHIYLIIYALFMQSHICLWFILAPLAFDAEDGFHLWTCHSCRGAAMLSGRCVPQAADMFLVVHFLLWIMTDDVPPGSKTLEHQVHHPVNRHSTTIQAMEFPAVAPLFADI